MARRALSWALVLVVALTVRPALAQTASPLKAIPGDAAVVVRVKGFQATLNKVAALADAVQPGSGNTVKFGGAAIGAGLKNPTMEGVDVAGDFYVAVFVEKDSVPGIVFVVPGKDLAAMEEALGEDVTFLKNNKHGIYSDDEELIDAVKEQLKSKEKDSLADSIDEKSMAVLNRGDISVFVNVPALLEVYKDELEQAKGAVGTIKDQVPPGETPTGVNMPAIMEKLQEVATILVQAIEDHEGISIALTVTDKDIVLEEFFKLEDDSESGKALKAGTGSDLGLLNSLPADSVGYYAVQCNISNMIAWSSEVMEAIISDEKALKVIKDAMAEMKGVKFNGIAGSFNLAKSKTGILNSVNLFSVDDPKKVRSLYQKSAAAMKEFEANGTKTEMTYKADAEKIGTTSIDLMTSKITISDDAPNAEKQREMMKAMYGEDGPVSRTAFLKDKLVQTMGGGKAAMESALKAAEGASRTPATGIQAVRTKLGTKPNFVGLLDVANLAVKGMEIAKEFGGDELPIDLEKITTGLSLKPSYIGFAVEVQDAAVSLKTVVPVDQMKNIGQIVKKAIAAQGEAN